MSRIALIGAGSWGTAFSGLLAAHAGEVALWCHAQAMAEAITVTRHNPRYLPGYEFAANISATSCLAEAARGADACVLALPSMYLRATCHELKAALPPDVAVLVLTKGIEPGSGLLMSEVASDELGGPGRVAALSGPNHAEEVCQRLPCAAVIASSTIELAYQLRARVATPAFRVYVSDDVRGVEVCGAVKNVIAIACGMCASLGYGDNTLALIMTRGLAEIGRMVRACGGKPLTCMGLAGMGDLVATCTSEHSRNRRFGEALASGATLESFERETHMVVEGAHAVVSVRELAEVYGVEVPISDAVWSVIYQGSSVESVKAPLMDRASTEEFYGMEGEPSGGKTSLMDARGEA